MFPEAYAAVSAIVLLTHTNHTLVHLVLPLPDPSALPPDADAQPSGCPKRGVEQGVILCRHTLVPVPAMAHVGSLDCSGQCAIAFDAWWLLTGKHARTHTRTHSQSCNEKHARTHTHTHSQSCHEKHALTRTQINATTRSQARRHTTGRCTHAHTHTESWNEKSARTHRQAHASEHAQR